MTSNVAQNYPYSSETEAERAAVIARLMRKRPELKDTLRAETTPLDANDRWWVWKCPTKGCPGSFTWLAMPATSTPSSSSATGPAARPFFADPRADYLRLVGPGGRIGLHVGIEAVAVLACLALTAWRRSLLPGLVAAVAIVALWRAAGLG